jgi:hypothetical protein
MPSLSQTDQVEAFRVVILALEKVRMQETLNLGTIFTYQELAAISVAVNRLARLVKDSEETDGTRQENS